MVREDGILSSRSVDERGSRGDEEHVHGRRRERCPTTMYGGTATNGPRAGNYMTDDQSTYWTNQPNAGSEARHGTGRCCDLQDWPYHWDAMLPLQWLTDDNFTASFCSVSRQRSTPVSTDAWLQNEWSYRLRVTAKSQLTQISYKLNDYSRNCLVRISPQPIISARIVRPWMPYNFVADSFHTVPICGPP